MGLGFRGMDVGEAIHSVAPTEVGVHKFNCLKVEKVLFRQFKLWIPVSTGMT